MTTKQIANFNFEKFSRKIGKKDGPIPLSELPNFSIDFAAMVNYAQERGVNVPELSDQEKKQFMHEIE